MALYNRGNLPSTASVASPAYRRAAFQHFQADFAPVRRAASAELEQEMASRGLSGGGIPIQRRVAQRGDFLRELATRRQELGLQQAGLGEENRQMLEDRAARVQDLAVGQGFEDEMDRLATEARDAQRRQALFNRLWGSAGRIGGALAADRFGGRDETGGGEAAYRKTVKRFGAPTVPASDSGAYNWDEY